MENQSCTKDNNGEVDHCRRRSSDESCQEMVQNASHQEFSLLLEPRPTEWHIGSWRRRQIHRVPPQLRLRGEQSQHVYVPVMVSLGPYHHGKPEFCRAEEFKYLCLDWCAGGNEEKKGFFYNKVLEKIDEIRNCYAEVTIVQKYDDTALALMMLLDACFIINFMENGTSKNKNNNIVDWFDCLGVAASLPFALCDIMVVENQIPFQVIKLLMSLLYEEEKAEGILGSFLSWMLLMELKQVKIPRINEEPPIHILEACWRVLVEKHEIAPNQLSILRWPSFSTEREKMDEINLYYKCRSVMDLKAKGIHFSPNSSQTLKDIKFKSRASYGQLQLPVRRASYNSQVILSNLIAYEVSPSTKTELVVLSYMNFMKSLIQSPGDVKEMQEKGILLNEFANHEQVVKMFKEINTFGLASFDSFKDVKLRIEEHCSSKAKTWVADLIHTWFQTPWTAIALFAATLLLCLTFLQTFFAIRPIK